jgi:hypothetical protein
MQDTKDSPYCTSNAICDGLRYLSDASYAILPRDVAHQLAEVEKNLLGGIRWLIDKKINWIDDRVAGGDQLREEWQRSARSASQETGSAPV